MFGEPPVGSLGFQDPLFLFRCRVQPVEVARELIGHCRGLTGERESSCHKGGERGREVKMLMVMVRCPLLAGLFKKF